MNNPISGNRFLPRLYDDHIGYMKCNDLYFIHSDSVEAFEHNGKLQPIEWKYKYSAGKLVYKFNEMGFRSHYNINDISDKPYIATVGCSHTMGTGLFYNETYSHHLEELTGLPVYNMGLSASSNEVSLLNVTWLLSNYNPPHTLVYQRASSARMPLIYEEDPSDGQLIFIGPWIGETILQYRKDYEKLLTIADDRGYTKLRDTMIEMSIRQQCKKLDINLVILDVPDLTTQYTGEKDFSRDMAHYGNAVNLYWAKKIIDQVQF